MMFEVNVATQTFASPFTFLPINHMSLVRLPINRMPCFLFLPTDAVHWSTPMAAPSLPAFIRCSPVTVLLDPSSESSRICPALVHRLDLLCSFGISGVQLATPNLHVPTDDSGYHSCLSFFVSYDLASDLVLGDDWLAAWLTDFYGPIHYETNALVVNGDTLKAWHMLVVATHS